jgi:hypothetical protein
MDLLRSLGCFLGVFNWKLFEIVFFFTDKLEAW